MALGEPFSVVDRRPPSPVVDIRPLGAATASWGPEGKSVLQTGIAGISSGSIIGPWATAET